eukprot:2032713-Rhodomonas_salina.2
MGGTAIVYAAMRLVEKRPSGARGTERARAGASHGGGGEGAGGRRGGEGGGGGGGPTGAAALGAPPGSAQRTPHRGSELLFPPLLFLLRGQFCLLPCPLRLSTAALEFFEKERA